ncbi:gtpase-activating protein [Anaeramoeba flamelloides]|uniref:Gtpase-activating protein n=1 Tax=Anaeramoeba flamelloides TaxID=1746091 RepID=A0ABQ8XFS1_9EUKA|nr:gtpase-activating protein [Anaeramoeba flamelloides]
MSSQNFSMIFSNIALEHPEMITDFSHSIKKKIGLQYKKVTVEQLVDSRMNLTRKKIQVLKTSKKNLSLENEINYFEQAIAHVIKNDFSEIEFNKIIAGTYSISKYLTEQELKSLKLEFKNSVGFGSILRSNSPVTKLIGGFIIRKPGISYLQSVLTKHIDGIYTNEKLNLDLNALRVYTEIFKKDMFEQDMIPLDITNEMALENEEVQKELNSRLEKLKNIFDEILSDIIKKIDLVPEEIRMICKKIKSLTLQFYPETSEDRLYAMIGGFFFLRFINPSFISPNKYGIIEGKLSKIQRKTFTECAKIFQFFSNMGYAENQDSLFFKIDSKFVDRKKKQIFSFLKELCNIKKTKIDQQFNKYLLLARNELFIPINLQKIFFVQQTFTKYIDQIVLEKELNTDQLRNILLNQFQKREEPIPKSINPIMKINLIEKETNESGFRSLIQYDFTISMLMKYHKIIFKFKPEDLTKQMENEKEKKKDNENEKRKGKENENEKEKRKRKSDQEKKQNLILIEPNQVQVDLDDKKFFLILTKLIEKSQIEKKNKQTRELLKLQKDIKELINQKIISENHCFNEFKQKLLYLIQNKRSEMKNVNNKVKILKQVQLDLIKRNAYLENQRSDYLIYLKNIAIQPKQKNPKRSSKNEKN